MYKRKRPRRWGLALGVTGGDTAGATEAISWDVGIGRLGFNLKYVYTNKT